MSAATLNHSKLGKETCYPCEYDPSQLFPIARQLKRNEIQVPTPLPFSGFDIWNAFEISWLNSKGKPVVAMGEFIIPCTSDNIIESKSLKLYLNSFNQSTFDSIQTVATIITQDLSQAAGTPVKVKLKPIDSYEIHWVNSFNGICLDDLDTEITEYQINSSFLKTKNIETSETLYSNLLKSNCPVTNQPDWASLLIDYRGKKIDHTGLLKYIISFRNHNEFHEQCVERIFIDIQQYCQPQELTIIARYTRRGGIDINPYRSTNPNILPDNVRHCRQ